MYVHSRLHDILKSITKICRKIPIFLKPDKNSTSYIDLVYALAMTGIHEAEVPVQHRARSTVTSSIDVQGISIVNLPLTIFR